MWSPGGLLRTSEILRRADGPPLPLQDLKSAVSLIYPKVLKFGVPYSTRFLPSTGAVDGSRLGPEIRGGTMVLLPYLEQFTLEFTRGVPIYLYISLYMPVMGSLALAGSIFSDLYQ